MHSFKLSHTKHIGTTLCDGSLFCPQLYGLPLLLQIQVHFGELGIKIGAVSEIFLDVVVPDHQVGHVREGSEHRLLQLGAKHRVVELAAAAAHALDVVKDGDAQVGVSGGRSFLLVRADRLVGARRARDGGAAFLGRQEPNFRSFVFRI